MQFYKLFEEDIPVDYKKKLANICNAYVRAKKGTKCGERVEPSEL